MAAPRRYPQELRDHAVHLALSTGRPIAQVARDVGVHKEALRLWVHQARAEAAPPADALAGFERSELDRLRRENAELRRANELLRGQLRSLTTEFGRTGARRLPLLISAAAGDGHTGGTRVRVSPQRDAIDAIAVVGPVLATADRDTVEERTRRRWPATDRKRPDRHRGKGRIEAVDTTAESRRPRPGLRERKKAKTREAIYRHAMRLFREQGYSATTVDQIAEAAEVSQTTFFRYFPTKEAVVLQDDYDPVFLEALRSQPPDLHPISALRSALREVSGGMSGAEAAGERERHALIVTVPELRARMLEEFIVTVRRIGDLIAERLDRPADDFAVRNLAGAITGVVMSVYLDAAVTPSAGPFALLDEALAHLEAGLPL